MPSSLYFVVLLKLSIPCGRKPEYPEKTHDFRQSVDGLFSLYGYHNVHNGNRTHNISEVKGACSDDWATGTETPGNRAWNNSRSPINDRQEIAYDPLIGGKAGFPTWKNCQSPWSGTLGTLFQALGGKLFYTYNCRTQRFKNIPTTFLPHLGRKW
jgi:hypothetical protein